MATIDGARALGLSGEIGSLEEGKRADLTIIDLGRLHLTPRPDLVSAIVYAAEAGDIRTALIDGRVVMRERELMTLDEREVKTEANRQAELLLARAKI
jgi:5-methylthioadenosine/S-adenosylhomocysteine deaminase